MKLRRKMSKAWRLNSLFLIFISVALLDSYSFAQEKSFFERKEKKDNQKKDPLLSVRVQKNGLYFGLQQGRYTFGELGTEIQFKKVKLKNPITHGIQFGAEYNLFENVLGFNVGGYRKPGRFDFTYGANILYRSDFEEHRFAVGPSLGYKVFGFHIQTGYLFHTPAENFEAINTLYISARFLLVRDRKTTITRRKKEK